ncbi:MAG: Por secretion system protein [Bacteroidales bacterium]|nr:Por secretion system protein [Bacteroidales bacterium]
MKHYRIFLKQILTFLFLFVLIFNTSAQTAYTDPEFPIADDPVTVYFNATGTPLENYNGDVYTHTGITVNGDQWQHVIGEWGINTTQPKLTKVSSNLYKLEMTPNIRNFYGASASEEITEMCFVFRNSESNLQSVDLFLPVFSDELSIFLQEPQADEFFILENDNIEIYAISPQADSMFVLVNDIEVVAVEGIYLDAQITAESYGNYWAEQMVKIVAKNSEDTVFESFIYKAIPENMAELPTGVIDGINYIDENTVILSLYAPLKKFVFVVGEFNNWEANENSYMHRTSDGDRYWIQIDGLVAGQEYAYQYVVDDLVRVGDPYCEKVLDPWNDQYIGNTTYPNLKPYPTGYGQGIVSVLQTNQEVYAWQNNGFTAPDVTDLVIYELLVRDFTEGHTFNSTIGKLQYFKDLGINAIELMPVNEFEGNLSWGYNPNYYFAVDKYYGPKNSLKAFVDACHNEGIAVILDVVYNHSFGTSPYVMMYWDNSINRPSDDSPFYNVEPKHDFNVGYDMNHESTATKHYISRALKFWLEEFHVDGYRFDLSKGFTQNNTLGNTGQWGQYDASRIDILEDYADTIWSVNEDAYVILEHFADNSEEKVLANNGMMLWGNMNYNYLEAAMGYTENSNLDWASYQERDWNNPNLVAYMESHDEERMMYKNVTWGREDNPDYLVTDTNIALKRVPLAAAFFFNIPGPKMIWQFGELGYDYSIEYNGRTGEKPIRWDYFDNYWRRLDYNLFASMIHLKTNYPTFRTTDFDLNVGGAQKQIHLNHAEMNATIIGNFDVFENDMTVSFQHTGKWYDYFAGDSIDISSSGYDMMLAPGEFRIFTDKKLIRPEIGLGVEDQSGFTGGFSAVYPNPSGDKFNIALCLDEKADVSLSVYSITGSKIKVILDEEMNPGEYTFVWYGTDDSGQKVQPGLYFAELIINGNREIKKLSLF